MSGILSRIRAGDSRGRQEFICTTYRRTANPFLTSPNLAFRCQLFSPKPHQLSTKRPFPHMTWHRSCQAATPANAPAANRGSPSVSAAGRRFLLCEQRIVSQLLWDAEGVGEPGLRLQLKPSRGAHDPRISVLGGAGDRHVAVAASISANSMIAVCLGLGLGLSWDFAYRDCGL